MVLFRNDSDKFTNYWCRQTSTYDNLSEYVRDSYLYINWFGWKELRSPQSNCNFRAQVICDAKIPCSGRSGVSSLSICFPSTGTACQSASK